MRHDPLAVEDEEPYRALAAAVIMAAFRDLGPVSYRRSAAAFLLEDLWHPESLWRAWLDGVLPAEPVIREHVQIYLEGSKEGRKHLRSELGRKRSRSGGR